MFNSVFGTVIALLIASAVAYGAGQAGSGKPAQIRLAVIDQAIG